MLRYKFSLLIAFVLIFISCKQDPEIIPVDDEIPNREQNVPGWFYSEILKSNRYIYLRLPTDYDKDSDQTYPTIYLLDANWYFDGTSNRIQEGGIEKIVNQLIAENSIPEVILVGIGNLNDYDAQMRGVDFHSDKTPNFLRFIKEELIPEVDAKYNRNDTTEIRTLIGHSSGGYFSTYSFFNNLLDTVHSINNYISLSVLGNDDYANIKAEEYNFSQQFVATNPLNIKLFLGVGADEEERFLLAFNHLIDSLGSRNYSSFSLVSKIYPDHNHSSYISEAVEDGLISFFYMDIFD